jgi:hypothetical protein
LRGVVEGRGNEGFAAVTAAATGLTKQRINQLLAEPGAGQPNAVQAAALASSPSIQRAMIWDGVRPTGLDLEPRSDETVIMPPATT